VAAVATAAPRTMAGIVAEVAVELAFKAFARLELGFRVLAVRAALAGRAALGALVVASRQVLRYVTESRRVVR